MNHHRNYSLSACVVFALVAASTASCIAATILTTVTVTVHDSVGQPLQDVPLMFEGWGDFAFGMTDVSGQVVLTVDREELIDETAIVLTPGIGVVDGATAKAREDRINVLMSQYSLPCSVLVTFAPGETAKTIDIIAYDAIEVTGQLKTPAGVPMSGVIDRPYGPDGAYAYPAAGGAFTLPGVRKDVSTALAVMWAGKFAKVIELSAAQTSANFDVGVITADEPALDASLSLEVFRPVTTDLSGERNAFLVSIVRDDGSLAMFFRTTMEDPQKLSEFAIPLIPTPGVVPEPPVAIPAGTYYVTPGIPSRPTATALVRALMDGRGAVLDVAGVPKFTVLAGQTATVVIDAEQVMQAIQSVAGDLTE